MNLIDISFQIHRVLQTSIFLVRMLMLDKKVWLKTSAVIHFIYCVKIKIIFRLVFVHGCVVMLEQEGAIPKLASQSWEVEIVQKCFGMLK